MQGTKEFPPEARGWNWGAFLLTWIWGICNNSFIALLTLIPAVSFIMMFVLGAKGNEWAWSNKNWTSVEEFHRAQRRWALAGVLFWAVLLFVFLVIPIGLLGWGVKTEWPQIMSMVKDFEPQRRFVNYALQEAGRNPRLQERLGAPLRVNGRIETVASGDGYMETMVPVHGPKGNATLFVRSRHKKNEEIKLEKAEVELENLEREPIKTAHELKEIHEVEGQIVNLQMAIRKETSWDHREPQGEAEAEKFFHQAIDDVAKNAEVREIFGERFNFKMENARVNLEGPRGDANFIVAVSGNGHEGKLTFSGFRSFGRWRFGGAQIRTASRTIQIPMAYED